MLPCTRYEALLSNMPCHIPCAWLLEHSHDEGLIDYAGIPEPRVNDDVNATPPVRRNCIVYNGNPSFDMSASLGSKEAMNDSAMTSVRPESSKGTRFGCWSHGRLESFASARRRKRLAPKGSTVLSCLPTTKHSPDDMSSQQLMSARRPTSALECAEAENSDSVLVLFCCLGCHAPHRSGACGEARACAALLNGIPRPVVADPQQHSAHALSWTLVFTCFTCRHPLSFALTLSSKAFKGTFLAKI